MGRPPEEAEVRKLRAYYEGSAVGVHSFSHQIVALCDSWLAQGRVIEQQREALGQISRELEDAVIQSDPFQIMPLTRRILAERPDDLDAVGIVGCYCEPRSEQ